MNINYLWLIFAGVVGMASISSNGVAHSQDQPLLPHSSSSLAKGLVVSDTYFWVEETDTPLYWYQVLFQRDWQVAEAEINVGYQHQRMWVKQHIQAQQAGHWVFQISYPLLDKVDFYLLQNGELIKQLHTGDLRPYGPRFHNSPNFVFDIESTHASRWTLLVRMETKGSLMMPATWWDVESFQHRHDQELVAFGAYYGILVIMAMYNLFIFLSIRERAYLFYVLSVTGLMFLQLTFDGRGFAWFWSDFPEFNRWAFPVAYCLYQLAILSFMMEFIQPRKYSIWLHRHFSTLRIIALINLFLLPWFPYDILMPLIVLIGMASIISGVLAGAYLWHKGNISARYFTLGWTVFIIGLLIVNLRGFGIFTSHLIVIYSYLLGSVLEVLLLSFALADRITRTQQAKNRAEGRLIESQQQLLETLNQYRELYENSPIGNFQANMKFEVTNVNSTCVEMFRFDSVKEMLNEMKDIRSYLTSPISELNSMMDQVREKGAVANQELQFKNKYGEPLWVALAMRTAEKSGLTTLEGSAIDITSRKAAELLNLRLEKERLQIVEQFSLGIAKEINTPLGSNVATTAFIQESTEDLNEKQSYSSITIEDYEKFVVLVTKSLGLLQENQKRIARVVKRFREVSAQHFGLQYQNFYLSEILNETIANMRWKMAGWRIHLNCSEEIYMKSFPKAISVVIDQLLDNAMAHSNSERRHDPIVWIEVTESKNDRVKIQFRDNGQGIKPELVDKLCQPFFTTKRGPKGHIGLGLYMVFNLVNRALNGFLTFPQNIHQGFVVEIDLPKETEA